MFMSGLMCFLKKHLQNGVFRDNIVVSYIKLLYTMLIGGQFMTNRENTTVVLKKKSTAYLDLRLTGKNRTSASHFKARKPKVDCITIKKNGDYNTLPF